MLAFGFGLSMDYEVFCSPASSSSTGTAPRATARSPSVSSARSHHHLGGSAHHHRLRGIRRGDILIIKEMGVALVAAVAIDATLVRMLLVPATMTVLGQ